MNRTTAYALLLAASLFGGCEPRPAGRLPAQPSADAVPANPVPTVLDRAAPDVVIPALGGGTFRLSDYRGKVLVVNFWATWCAPCREEIPGLVDLQRELGPEAFSVIGMTSVLYEDEATDVATFVDEMQMNYPVGLDYGDAADAFGGVFALPTTYIIDKNFVVRHRIIGLPSESIRPTIEALIAENQRSASPPASF